VNIADEFWWIRKLLQREKSLKFQHNLFVIKGE
jgi:hypothetical protein